MTEPTKEQKPEQNAAKTDENAAKIGATLQDQLKDEDPQKVEEKKTDGAPKIEEKAKNDESLRAELAAQRSIRVLPKMEVAEDDKGEKLSACTENEWDASAEPFSAELLNVKNAPVFGMKPGDFRHDDHKFEMTRQEFADWLAELAVRYPHYQIEPPQFIGMTPGHEMLSGASQAAICILRDNVSSQLPELTLPYKMTGHIPCRLGSRLVAYNLVRQAFLEWIEKVEFRDAELRNDSFSPYWLFDVRHVLHHLHAPISFAATIQETVAW
uniref:Small RNA 2'-O-methyltransferase n=1 Tax=Caenorhabditis japonica TaxID=281687 RepID=A0A8R1J1P8_CAEJA